MLYQANSPAARTRAGFDLSFSDYRLAYSEPNLSGLPGTEPTHITPDDAGTSLQEKAALEDCCEGSRPRRTDACDAAHRYSKQAGLL
jgi:hypothetical protein